MLKIKCNFHRRQTIFTVATKTNEGAARAGFVISLKHYDKHRPLNAPGQARSGSVQLGSACSVNSSI